METDSHATRPAGGPAERLLSAADRLFYEQGFAATGVNELLKEAGVAKASFYHHFPSKVDLVVAYLEQRQELWSAKLNEVLDRHRDPKRRVLALFDFLQEWLLTCDYRGCAFLNAVPEFPDPSGAPREVVRRAKAGLRERITELLTAAGHADAADEVFLLFEGATVHAAAVHDPWPVHAAREAVRQRLERAGSQPSSST